MNSFLPPKAVGISSSPFQDTDNLETVIDTLITLRGAPVDQEITTGVGKWVKIKTATSQQF